MSSISKNISLDAEAIASRTAIKSAAAVEFHCFRSYTKKKSKSKYERKTSQGLKVVCNGATNDQWS